MRNYLNADFTEKYVLSKLKILQSKECSVSNLLPEFKKNKSCFQYGRHHFRFWDLTSENRFGHSHIDKQSLFWPMKIDLISEERFGHSHIDKESLFSERDFFGEKAIFVALGRTPYATKLILSFKIDLANENRFDQ